MSANLEALQRKKKDKGPAIGYRAEASTAPETMDWEATTTTVVTVQAQRAQWVTPEVLERRRELEQCIRCGKQGHMIRQCALLKARRPREKKVITASTAVEDVSEEEKE